MQCPSLTLQAVGMFCRGGKAMNEPSANLFLAILPYILRCFIPLIILFGVSYLLRRMGLVAIETPEPKEELEDSVQVATSQKLTKAPQSKKPQKRKAAPSRKKPAAGKLVGKKPAAKTKTGNSRSRSK